MKIKLLALLLSVLLIVSATYAQNHGEHDHHHDHDHDHDHDQHEVQFDAAADDDNDDEAEAYQNDQQGTPSQEQQAAVMRELTIICIVVAKHQLNSYGQDLVSVLTGAGSQQEHHLFYRKVLAEHIQTCLKSINPQDAQQIVSELQEKTFAVEKYGQYFIELTLERYQNPQFDRVITPQETQILRTVDEMEKNWKDQQEIQEEEEEASGQKRLKPEDYEPRILGISSKEIPTTLKLLYFLLVFGVIAIIIYYGYQKIISDDEFVQPKKKKNKVADKKAK